MALNIFPTSPLPAGLNREWAWNENIAQYDSGEQQGISPWIRPLARYSVPWKNISDLTQDGLSSFYNLQKGRTTPFLMKDPDEFRVNSVFVTSGAVTEPASLWMFDLSSFFMRVDTTTIGSMTSNKSGFVTLGNEYDYDQDTGNLTVKSIDTDDYWTATSLQHFKKCVFDSKYQENVIIWGQFSIRLAIKELP